MTSYINDLNDIEYKILQFVSKHESVSKDDIIKAFPKVSSIEYHLKRLSEQRIEKGCSNEMIIRIDNTSYLLEEYERPEWVYSESKNLFSITDLGIVALHENSGLHRKNFRRSLSSSIKWVVGIIIATITAIATIITALVVAGFFD